MKIEKEVENIEMKFFGENSWRKFRDFTVLKMQECKTEEGFIFILKAILGSLFTSPEAINEARQDLGLRLLSKDEEIEINKLMEKK